MSKDMNLEIEELLYQLDEIISSRDKGERFCEPIRLKDNNNEIVFDMYFRNDAPMMIRNMKTIRDSFVVQSKKYGVYYDQEAKYIYKLNLKRKPNINSDCYPLYFKQLLGRHFFVQLEGVFIDKKFQRKGLLKKTLKYILSIDGITHVVINNIINDSWYRSLVSKQECGDFEGHRYAIFDASYNMN
ncbi:hypothetical protein [Vibrio campbellii]|uniref:hypothetical protein n=1 Tax=Vibrio campbellii TaxID=680 RepID=UPI003F84C73F